MAIPCVNHLDADMPEVVCLCGSIRFVETFDAWREKLTCEGKIVLSIEITGSTDPRPADPELKKMLDELHMRKIDLANTVMVLNVNNYIGESTRKEIAYAQRQGKRIRYLENQLYLKR